MPTTSTAYGAAADDDRHAPSRKLVASTLALPLALAGPVVLSAGPADAGPGDSSARAGALRPRAQARSAQGRGAARRLPRRPDHRRHRGERPHQPRRLGRPARRRDPQPVGRPGDPGRRLLPGHLHDQHQQRLEPRQPVRGAAARRLERQGWSSAGRRARARQYANDFIISDWVLARGYAFASTDKGNSAPRSTATAPAGRRRSRVAPPRHPARQGHQGGRRAALQPAPAADLHVRHLQRRLPDPLAAREPARAVRRRPRLGGHAVARARPQPVHLPADGVEATTRPTPRPATRPPTTR